MFLLLQLALFTLQNILLTAECDPAALINLANGGLQTDRYYGGDNLLYFCDDGYTTTTDPVCTQSGNWSHDPGCVESNDMPFTKGKITRNNNSLDFYIKCLTAIRKCSKRENHNTFLSLKLHVVLLVLSQIQ